MAGDADFASSSMIGRGHGWRQRDSSDR